MTESVYLTKASSGKLAAGTTPESRNADNECSMHIWRQLKEMREQAGLTQTQLSERTGIDQATISWLESPRYPYSRRIGTLERIAKACGRKVKVEFV